MNNKRIVEEIDSNGVSSYYPQYKFLFWWMYYEGYPCGRIMFTNLNACKEWLGYERITRKVIHNI